MNGPTLLCLDTSTAAAFVGVVAGGALRAERRLQEKRRHAELMYDVIGEVLRQAEIGLHDLDAIAVGLGPGSFIGVRVAVATAKGLALGADLPVIGVSTPAAAALASGASGRVAVALDAKKGQVYAAAYEVAASAPPGLELLAPCALDPGACAARFAELAPLAALLGDGPARYADAFAPLAGVVRGPAEPRPLALYTLAAARAARGDFDDPALLVPSYARRSEAEEKRDGRQRAPA